MWSNKIFALLLLVIPFMGSVCFSQPAEAPVAMEIYTVLAFKQIAFEVRARYTPLQMKIDIISGPANFDKTDVKGICMAMNLSGLKYRDLGAPGSFEIKVNWPEGFGPDAYFLTTVERMIDAEKELHEKKTVRLEGYFDFVTPGTVTGASAISTPTNTQARPSSSSPFSLSEAVALGRKYLADGKVGEANTIFEILRRIGKGSQFESEIEVWSNLTEQESYKKWPETKEMVKENARNRTEKGVGKFTGKFESIQIGDLVHFSFKSADGKIEEIQPKLGVIEFIAEHPDDEFQIEYQIVADRSSGEPIEHWDAFRIVTGNQNSDDFLLGKLKVEDLQGFNDEMKPKLDALYKRFEK